MHQKTLLHIQNLHLDFASKSYARRNILKGVNIQIGRGEGLALIGESGSGKSVTAQCIMRLLGSSALLTKGEIWFDGAPLHLLNSKEMQKIRGKKIGMVSQDPLSALNPIMTIGKQISEAIMQHENLSKKQAYGRAVELLTQMGLSDPELKFNAYPFQLSGGMRQRVCLAIALACRPLMLIADEPTTALDMTVQAQILTLIRNLCAQTQMSLLLITHDIGVAVNVCKYIAVMYRGEIVETAPAEQLLVSPQHPYTQALLKMKLS